MEIIDIVMWILFLLVMCMSVLTVFVAIPVLLLEGEADDRQTTK